LLEIKNTTTAENLFCFLLLLEKGTCGVTSLFNGFGFTATFFPRVTHRGLADEDSLV